MAILLFYRLVRSVGDAVQATAVRKNFDRHGAKRGSFGHLAFHVQNNCSSIAASAELRLYVSAVRHDPRGTFGAVIIGDCARRRAG